jgi:peptidoglycan/xylan/chitin deacetylase (PgdA/CDA1 family)
MSGTRGRWLAGGALAGLAAYAVYHATSPTAQRFGKTFVGAPGAGSLLALTFDDGPHPLWTPRLLDVLDRHEVEATFFVIGANARQQPGVLRELASRGHAVGNHTDTHLRMPLHGARTIRDELRRTTDAIEAAGVEPASVDGHRLMRPPFGQRRPGTLRVVRAEGYLPVLWSLTLGDWKPGVTADAIVETAEERLRGGDVILLHDGSAVGTDADRRASVAATDRLVATWKDRGMRFVTIPAMVEAADAAPTPSDPGR